MSDRPELPVPHTDLEILISALEVRVIHLAECLVSPGWRLAFPKSDMPAIHYNLSGTGRILTASGINIPLKPHTLTIIPAHQTISIDGTSVIPDQLAQQTVEARSQSGDAPDAMPLWIAGDGNPSIVMVCGYFRASYGGSIELFDMLQVPIVEQFDAADNLEDELRSILGEIHANDVGMGAMTRNLLKQVFIKLIRRSLISADVWFERFTLLSDRHVARAFVEMLARPGAAHSAMSLAQTAGLSRSVFMARFREAFAMSPLATLRRIRMRQASAMLITNLHSIDQIAHAVGYKSRGSFTRVFREVFDHDPSEHRLLAEHPVVHPASSA